MKILRLQFLVMLAIVIGVPLFALPTFADDVVFKSHSMVIPDDPEFAYSASQLWGLYAISAPEAWARGRGDKATVVAVIDSGIDKNHEDLADNLWHATAAFHVNVGGTTIDCRAGAYGFDAIDDDCEPEERQRHGTNVSGVIGARGDNEKGTVGVNWAVSLLPVAFMGGSSEGSASRAAKALEFVRRVKESGVADVRVLNLSWGGHHHSRSIEDQLIALAEEGVVIVTSAGNEGRDNDNWPMYPASYDSVSTLISVAATGSDGNVARSSNHGKASVNIAAPGISIRTTDPNNSYDAPFGTSMAAAVVTGAVALLASQCPALTGMQLKELILRTADRRQTLEPYVSDGRFLNLNAASAACAAMRGEHREAALMGGALSRVMSP
ncbi:MAG TPA: S8 family serine peptidase [Thermoanaerobaculia bacterium]|nr:S8 family serine peptidase [Thermoanaerobaculia bacterium]